MDVSFIGSGNVAWHLAPALDNAGHVVREVYSRNPAHAESLTGRLYQAEVKATLDFSTSKSSLFIIATTDDAIKDVVTEIVLPDEAVLVHTSGSEELSVLQFAATTHIGVFYPLQTFTKAKRIDFRSVPIFVESLEEDTLQELLDIARELSGNVRKITSEERKALHVAAVFASNFTNHMLKLSRDIVQANGLSFDLLKPLIAETIEKSLALGPDKAQTGPAWRGDLEVLDRHLAFLQENEALAGLYKVISQNIIDTYKPE